MSETAVKKEPGMATLVLVLFAISAIVALLLGVTNMITKGPIQERADAAQGIDEAYMERYKAIRSQRFPVLASLRNDQCSGCNMSLPSAVAKQLQGSDEIVECENCGRILYITDAAQEAE